MRIDRVKLLWVMMSLLVGAGARAQTKPATPAVPPPPPTAAPAAAPTLPTAGDASFLETYPGLKEYVFVEPPSGYHLGFGVSPIGVLKDRTLFSADIFQLHWINPRFDVQILNASYGFTRAETSAYQSNIFTFSTAFTVRIGSTLSLGPLVGWEFVDFTNLKARLFKAPFISPEEPFSSQGFIYGVTVAQTFPWRSYLIQLSEVAYEETYSNVKTPQNWRFIYSDKTVRDQPSLIAPRAVALIKVSFLF